MVDPWFPFDSRTLWLFLCTIPVDPIIPPQSSVKLFQSFPRYSKDNQSSHLDTFTRRMWAIIFALTLRYLKSRMRYSYNIKISHLISSHAITSTLLPNTYLELSSNFSAEQTQPFASSTAHRSSVPQGNRTSDSHYTPRNSFRRQRL